MAESSNFMLSPLPNNAIDFNQIPLRALNTACRLLLSNALIIERPLPTSSYIARDWQGLCELAGISYSMTKFFRRKNNPVLEFLDFWGDSELNPSFQNLIDNLQSMERNDILEDAEPLLIKDARAYIRIQEHERIRTEMRRPIQDSSISSADSFPPPITIGEAEKMELGTYDGPEKFDAYVSYVETDTQFVTKLVEQLESVHKLKLYVKDRDMLLGVIECEADLEMINERCEKILLVVSEESISDPRCEFQSILAQASALDNTLRARKVIPVMCKPCYLPPRYKILARLDYTKRDTFGNFWRRLAISVRSSTMEGFATSRSGSPYSQISLLSRSPYGSNTSINEFSSSAARSSIELNSELNGYDSASLQTNSLSPNTAGEKRSRPSTPELVSIELNSVQSSVPESADSVSPPSQQTLPTRSTKKKLAGFFTRNSK